METYYIAVEEWLYPTESGREVVGDYDTYEDALRVGAEKCREELCNFSQVTHCDPTEPRAFISAPDGSSQGVRITCKNGLDEWWYAVKIIPVRHGMGGAR